MVVDPQVAEGFLQEIVAEPRFARFVVLATVQTEIEEVFSQDIVEEVGFA